GLLSLNLFNTTSALKTRLLTLIPIITLLIIGLRGMEKHLYDEIMMRQQFPLLPNFENELELERWEHKLVNIKRSKKYPRTGQYSLKVEFLPGRYPNISLEHFPTDWSGFNKLVFSVYNSGNSNLQYELKIYDLQHSQNGLKYNDRFNKEINIKPGWNTITQKLDEVIKAPRNRIMNIKKINGLSVFTDKLKKPITLYLDDIHLE
ncbi:MAG: hypothetical protein KAU21_19550, partial [Gammaproteobacteria bacterium]|nr:hypothetical protein [Gammaproteobacteria bacterium]